MEKQLLDRLTPADRAALAKISKLFYEAQTVWNQIDSGKQCELNAEHNEEGSLAHCLRWGTQAAEDLVKVTAGKPKKQPGPGF